MNRDSRAKSSARLILAACFFTDLGTVVALGMLFANYNLWLVALVAAIVAAMVLVPKILPRMIDRRGDTSANPRCASFLPLSSCLPPLATYAKSEGVLPAYFLGLACAGMMITYPGRKAAPPNDDDDAACAVLLSQSRNVHRVRGGARLMRL